MFLALDESIGSTHETLGCLCFPESIMPKLEAQFIQHRIEHKVWAEVKWQRLCAPYVEKYEAMVRDYLAPDDVTFHSWTYRIPTAIERRSFYDGIDASLVVYRHAYLLIRTIIWKCRNNGYTGPFYILADESGKLGRNEYKITQGLLKRDPKISPPPVIDFCMTGSSTACGAMQITDLITGAVMSHYDEKFSKQDSCTKFIKMLAEINGGIPLDLSSRTLPKLHDQKLHHCLYRRRGV